MSSPILRAAEATPFLARTRIRGLGSPSAVVLMVILFGVVAVLAIALDQPLVALAVFVSAIVLFVAWYVRATAAVRNNNHGVALLLRGDDAGATARFREVVGRWHSRDAVAMALHNLGVVALRARDVTAATAIFRACLEAGKTFRFKSVPDTWSALAHAHLGFALAVQGHVNEADAELAWLRGATPSHLPMAMAYAARAHAMMAIRSERYAEAVTMLDADKSLLRNVLTGNESVLAEAMLAHALTKLGGRHGEQTRTPDPVYADDEARSFVRAYLPEAEGCLQGRA